MLLRNWISPDEKFRMGLCFLRVLRILLVFVFRYKVEVHEQGVNMEFRRGDFLVYIELWLVLSPNGTLVRVHGKRRTFYAYGDTVVIKSQV